MKYLTNKIEFPAIEDANEDGILAIGGDLSTERLVLAYKSGIFPWYDFGPIIWWSPDPRFVLFPKKLKVSKSMKQFIKKSELVITFNEDFEGVIKSCASINRPMQGGTWITDEMVEAYIKLHRLGYAKSVEVWNDGNLIAGLYGIDLNNGIFCGESMFTTKSNASKLAFIYFIQNSDYKLIDCQVPTKHLKSLGAEEISRREFISYL